jgi:acetyl-CoA acyltransferase
MHDVVIVDAVRTAMGKSRAGGFRHIRAETLSAELMKALLLRNPGLPPEEIDDVYWGCVQQTLEQGFNIARNALLLAGLPVSVAGVTINRLCGSSMQALHDAARAIMVGDATVCLVGGVEHMGHIPMTHGVDFHPGLSHQVAQASAMMGLTGELLGRRYGISREQQDAFALRSHQKAAAASQRGAFAQQLIPLLGHDAEGALISMNQDEVIRFDASLAGLAQLKPAFDPVHGTLTAGNSSALSDGAAALLIMSAEHAKNLGLQPMAKLRAMAVAGCDAALMGYGPVPASRKALQRAGLHIQDIDLVEINEAFAAQSLPCLRELQLEEELEQKVNLNGGAIALGHPLGCSGARILTSLAWLMTERQARLGLATMCIGLGQGITTIIEKC